MKKLNLQRANAAAVILAIAFVLVAVAIGTFFSAAKLMFYLTAAGYTLPFGAVYALTFVGTLLLLGLAVIVAAVTS